jgi:response regulator of citrate/malate metabolism
MNWFHNHRKAKEDENASKTIKHVKKWTLRNVVRVKMAKEIVEKAKELAAKSEKAGSSRTTAKGNIDYLPHYPTAWTEICNELDEETREEYLDLVDEWNDGDVPDLVQQK